MMFLRLIFKDRNFSAALLGFPHLSLRSGNLLYSRSKSLKVRTILGTKEEDRSVILESLSWVRFIEFWILIWLLSSGSRFRSCHCGWQTSGSCSLESGSSSCSRREKGHGSPYKQMPATSPTPYTDP